MKRIKAPRGEPGQFAFIETEYTGWSRCERRVGGVVLPVRVGLFEWLDADEDGPECWAHVERDEVCVDVGDPVWFSLVETE